MPTLVDSGVAPPAGLVAGRYRLLEKLGEGGLGVVWRVRDEHAGQECALKRIRPERLDPARETFFRQEFRVLSRLSHPHLVAVYDFGSDRETGELYFSSEYCPGVDLHEACRQRPLEGRVELLVQVLRALQYIHGRGVLHFDVKPGNVRVGPQGLAKLFDFDLSGALGPAREGPIRGTVHFMAPELAAGKPVDHRIDIYSLGVTAYAVLTGRLPYRGQSVSDLLAAHARGDAPAPSQLDRGIPEPLSRAVLELMHPDPRRRIGAADEAIDRLGAAVGRSFPRETPETARSYMVGADLVGREGVQAELAALRERLAAGRGGVALIAGEPGVGKTRLVREFRVQCQLARVAFFEARCFAAGRRALGPIYTLLGALDDPQRLGERVSTLGLPPEILDFVPRADRGERPEDPERATLSQEARRARLIGGLSDLIAAYAEKGPLVLHLDDAHWADPVTLDLVRMLAQRVEERPCALVLSSRVEGAADLEALVRGLPHGRVLSLEPLQPDQVDLLLLRMLGGVEPPAALRQRVSHHAGGNPLLIEELMGEMVDLGVLQRRVGGWQVDAPALERAEPPRRLQELVAHRIALLGPTERSVVRFLAVLGGETEEAFLAQQRLESGEAAPVIERLVADGTLLRHMGEPRRVAFRYQVLGEAVQRMVRGDEAQALHLEAAAILQATGREDLYDALAGHYLEAGQRAKALAWLLRAGERAARTDDHERAVDLLGRAVQLAEELDKRESLRNARRKLANSCLVLGQHDRVRRLYRQLLLAESRKSERAALNRLMADLAFEQGDWDRARQHYERGLGILARTRGRGRGVADITLQLELGRALVLMHQGDPRAARRALLSLSRARRRLAPRERADIHNALSLLHHHGGRLGLAVRHARRCLQLYRDIGHTGNVARSLNNIAVSLLERGELAEAVAALQEAHAIAQRLRDPAGLSRSFINLGEACLGMGDLAKATGHFRRALEMKRELGEKSGEVIAQYNLARSLERQGQIAEALSQQRVALESAARIGDAEGVFLSHLHLAQIHDGAGAWAAALRHLRLAARSLAWRAQRLCAGAYRLILAAHLLERDRPAAADRLLRRAEADYEAAGDALGRLSARIARARGLGARGRAEEALELLRAARDEARRRGAGLLFLEAELARLELAPQLAGEAPEAARAQRVAERARALTAPELAWRAAQAEAGLQFARAKDRRGLAALVTALTQLQAQQARLPAELREGYLSRPAVKRLRAEIKRRME